MAHDTSFISNFFSPALCANNKQETKGVTVACQKDATNVCSSCLLVQYCSKQCQVADWKYHKASCKSAMMKSSWEPDWFRNDRQPAFMGGMLSAPLVAFGAKKYLWGNMPAVDILNISHNEGETDIAGRDLALLFAASGDLRNILKSLVGLPEVYKGECYVVANDKDFDIVARNVIMLMVALHFDIEVAVPMIIHLWYSGTLPHAMVSTLQSSILVMIDDVCMKIKDKPTRSLQAKKFIINGGTLRLVLEKEEWFKLATYFKVPDKLTLEDAQLIRRRVTLAPERIDYRERAMLQWPRALREVDVHFRKEGVFLPYGCSLQAFDVPNPTMFQSKDWPMKDSSSPREGWEHHEYMKFAPAAKSDEHGAIFFYLRDLLAKFCSRLRKHKIRFEMFCVDAKGLGQYVENSKFDRIEISNICDRGFLGPHSCIQVFGSLLKPKSENPKATILMLFLNAAAEMEYANKSSAKWESQISLAMQRLEKYMPLDRTKLAHIQGTTDLGRHPYFVRRSYCYDLLKDWDYWFDMFLRENDLVAFAKSSGIRVKRNHTIIQPWPYKAGARTAVKDFDILRARGTSGYERYLEMQRE